MHKNLLFSTSSISETDLLNFVEKYANDSVIPLYERVNIPEFAHKIHSLGVSFEAWHEGQLLGILVAYVNNLETRESYICYFRVIPECRGMGIASQLLNNLFSYCKQHHFNAITLEVAQPNKAAIALYEKNLFTIDGENKNSYFMRKKLI